MKRDSRLSGVLHVLVHLGHATGPLTSEVLARTMGTNPAVLRRTMAGLRNAGYVQTGKGPGGGWALARPLTEISLFDVYAALGRPDLFAMGHRSANPQCKVERAVNVALAGALDEAEAVLLQRFRHVSLDQIDPLKLQHAAHDDGRQIAGH